MPKETFNSPILQLVHDSVGGWRSIYDKRGEHIFIEDDFSEEELIKLAEAILEARDNAP